MNRESTKGCVVLGLVTQSCPTLCNPMDCNLPGSSVHGDSPGKNTGVGCHALLQGIFPTQGSNLVLPYCRWILYCLSHQGSTRILEWIAYTFSSGTSQSRESNWGLLHCRWILQHLSYPESPSPQGYQLIIRQHLGRSKGKWQDISKAMKGKNLQAKLLSQDLIQI